jgi:hypothetical protein
MILSGLWDEMKGLDEAKEIIERRVILPLAERAGGSPCRRGRRRSSCSALHGQ